MSALKELFSGLDPESLLSKLVPQLDTLLGWIVFLTRLAVMAVPLLLLGFGLLYLLTPPKEANFSVGYRFWWGMASLDAWRFTQKLAGIVWSCLGLLLTLIMAIICAGFADMPPMDMVWTAGKCAIWEFVLALLSCLGINITVMVFFDRYGYRRKDFSE